MIDKRESSASTIMGTRSLADSLIPPEINRKRLPNYGLVMSHPYCLSLAALNVVSSVTQTIHTQPFIKMIKKQTTLAKLIH